MAVHEITSCSSAKHDLRRLCPFGRCERCVNPSVPEQSWAVCGQTPSGVNHRTDWPPVLTHCWGSPPWSDSCIHLDSISDSVVSLPWLYSFQNTTLKKILWSVLYKGLPYVKNWHKMWNLEHLLQSPWLLRSVFQINRTESIHIDSTHWLCSNK